jgi:hypothetical protein
MSGVAKRTPEELPVERLQTGWRGPGTCPDTFFLDASGSWREAFHHNSWWAVGRHLVYPARDKDDARRICRQLSQPETMPRVVKYG